jgi:glycosyltransferase involved in cell wall biosynthesis
MKIVHVSFANVRSCADPRVWLRKIQFFTGIVLEMTKSHEVFSIHSIDYEGPVAIDNAKFLFIRRIGLQRFLPTRVFANVRMLNPDVVIVHGLTSPFYTTLLSMATRPATRIYVQHHAERPLTGFRAIIQRYADSKVAGYFFCAFDLAELWLKAGQIRSREKIHEVMEVSSPFRPVDITQARQQTEVGYTHVYLWVGRLDDNKDPETLIKAFASFARTHASAGLYVIYAEGEASRLSALRHLASAAGHQINFIGSVDHERLLYWYNASDFILSTSHYEGSGVAVCEGMSCGCIPVLTNIPSFRMMSGNGSLGYLFEPGDVQGLQAALGKTIELNISSEKEKVLKFFAQNLSFAAIADRIHEVISDRRTSA